MSATLDAQPVAEVMQAPVLTSEGRAFDVAIRHLEKPVGKVRFEQSMTDLIQRAMAEAEGSALVFLPGEGEIRRVESALRLPTDCDVVPLFGAMPFAAQQKAIRPAASGRRNAVSYTHLTLPTNREV